jgi:hypothetical protein
MYDVQGYLTGVGMQAMVLAKLSGPSMAMPLELYDGLAPPLLSRPLSLAVSLSLRFSLSLSLSPLSVSLCPASLYL